MMTEVQGVTAFNAFENQLKTLALQEFPCGIGRWKENYGKKRKQIEKDKVTSRYAVTLKDFGADFEKTETLEELVITKDSPWNLDYSWSNEAKDLREIAVRSPWLIDDNFVLGHFKTLRIVDKDVTQVDENFLKFYNLEELSLSVNRIRTVNSKNLPSGLKVLELCANNISTLADLCPRPPAGLIHLGLGYNSITMVDDYITGEYWPSLLSLDLSHNNLYDMMDIVRKLQTLPKLRNLMLLGNPLALIPAYRGYTIDSLRKLSFLDDIIISADEKHHFKGLAKRKEYILDEAKVVLKASYIKGLPMPEEQKFPEEQPEFPIVTRKYFIQFMFLEDKSTNAEIFQILQDDQMSTTDPSSRETQTPSVNTIRTSEAGGATFRSKEEAIAELPDENTAQDVPAVTLTAPTEMQHPRTPQSAPSRTGTVTPDPDQPEQEATKAPIRLTPINSASSEWAEDVQLNWVKTVSRDDLVAFRDFLNEGMKISVMEEKIDQYPADQFQQDEPTSPAPSTKSKEGKKDKKPDKKDDKGKDKGKDDKGKGADKGGDKKQKKKGEPDVELTAMPSEYRTLATFFVPLADFLDGEFEFENVYTCDSLAQQGNVSPTSEVSSKNKDKAKDKKKPGSAKKKDGKADKESLRGNSPAKRSSSRASKTDGRAKSAKKDDKKDKKDVKGKEAGKVETEEEPSTPPPPLEIHVKVKLEHWKTAMDSMKAEEDSEKQEGTEAQ